MTYVGDIRLGDTFDVKFCTVNTSGAPTTLAGSPVISAYVGNSTTQLTAGITLSVDFDGVTGLHNVRVVATSGNGYATASNYQLVITTGTVGGTSVVGYVVAQFSIEARSALMPTVAARTLDVTATGAAGVDWANVEAPTTTLALTGTTIAVTQKVDVDTIKTNPVVNGGTITFPTTATLASTTNITAGTVTTATNVTTVNGLAANVVTAAAIANGAIDAATFAAGAIDAAAIANGAIDAATFAAGAIDAAAIANGAIDAATFAAGAIDAAALATDAVAEIADGVWDEAIAGHLGAGSTGAALNAAGSSGDPWATPLPGAYGAGTAGKIIGDNINATVSSRATQTSLDTLDDFVDTEVAAIKTKTDFLPSATAGAAGGLFIAGSNAATTANLTGNITGNLSGSVGSVTGAVGSVTGAVGSVTGNVGGNVVGSVASVTAGVTTTAADQNASADALLNRDMSIGTDSGSPTVRTPRQALRFNRNKWSIAAGTLTVTKEDDTTASWTAAVTQTAGNPVSTIDPA